MKKRLLALLLTVTMVMGMFVMPVAAESTGMEPTEPKTCPHCGVAWDKCNWQVLIIEEPDKTIPDGHYYLTEDLNITTRYKVGTSDGQTADLAVDVCLDLRGFDMTQTTADCRAFYVYDYSTLSIMDSAGGGAITGTGATGSNAAGGTIYACKDATVNLYSGTLTNAQTDRTGSGGILFLNTDAVFNMYGGIIDASQVTHSADYTSARGPAIFTNGTVNISGGMVIGGQSYQGASIGVSTTGVVNVSGGTLLGGTSTSHGGNLYSQGTVNISGGLITGGYATGGRGGCVYSSGTSADLQISGGVIENGQCSSGGGNVSAYGGKLTVTGGTIRGNMYTSTSATFSGAPIINNNDYEGLQITGGTMDFSGLTEGAEILISGERTITDATVTTNAQQLLDSGILKPSTRYDLQVVDGALVTSLDDNGYCPHCQQEITWVPYAADIATSGHYYIPSGGVSLPDGSAGLTIAEGVDIVLNLAHGSAKPATQYQVAGTLSVLSTAGSVGRVTTSATESTLNGATLNVTGTLNLYDGILGSKSGVTTTGNGGVVYLNGGKLNMYGGWITGNTAANGGALYMNGSAATVNMHGGVISGGTATAGGGNVYMYRGTFNMNGGLILNGSANAAGNIYNNTSGKLNINGGIVALGTATGTGGNLRHAATSCVTTMTDGLFYGGTAPDGGNCYINNGKFTMTGGSIADGTATTGHSGNIYAHAGYYYINKGEEPTSNWLKIGDKDPTDSIPAPQIIGGRAATSGGNINATGNLTLGDCFIAGGRAAKGDNMVLGDKAYFTVEAGLTGELVIYLTTARVNQLKDDRALANTTCTELNADLYAENYDMAYLLPTAEGKLGLGGAALVEVATGKQTWFVDAQAAADACKATQYVRLYAPESTLEMDGMLVLDMNGCDLTVTGSGKLYGFDTANDEYEVYGTATVTGVTVEPMYMAPNNRRYVTVSDETGTSFHRLRMGISHVALRPAVSGLYYKGLWQCDSVLAEKIDTYGVAVSLENMPGADFATDEDTLYTVLAGDTFESGTAQPSAMIANILSEGSDNDSNGRTPIYATTYAVMTDGTVLAGDDNQLQDNGVDYSLYDLFRSVNRIWPKLSDDQKASVKTLYGVDVPTMESWELYNITAAINGTPAYRPLKILTLGHSLALDAGHMLNLVAGTEGFSGLTVATLYYSGCPLYKHVKHLQEDLPEYNFYLSSSDTPDQIPTITKGVTMKYGIEYDDWDIIIMQGGVFEIAYSDKYTDGNIQIIQDYVNQHKTNPDAIFAWNSPWAPPTTNSLRDKYPYEPNSYYTSYEAFNHDRTTMYNAITQCLADHIVTDDSFIYLIPSCTAIENALSSYLEETDLHRDYVHMSDLGRVITSYTWYCTLAGIDHLDEVKLDAIPVAFLKSTSDKTQDRVLTDAEKAVILESVNNALADPLHMTQSVYTTAP